MKAKQENIVKERERKLAQKELEKEREQQRQLEAKQAEKNRQKKQVRLVFFVVFMLFSTLQLLNEYYTCAVRTWSQLLY